jgi:hypothetical protein
MSHVVVLHYPGDAHSAAAVAAVLTDYTAFRAEVSPERPPFNIGSDVVAVSVWTSRPPRPADVEALGAALRRANGRAIALCFGGAKVPDSVRPHVIEVLDETADPAEDQRRMRAAISRASRVDGKGREPPPRPRIVSSAEAAPPAGQEAASSPRSAQAPAAASAPQLAASSASFAQTISTRPEVGIAGPRGWILPLAVGLVMGGALGAGGVLALQNAESTAAEFRSTVAVPELPDRAGEAMRSAPAAAETGAD